MTESSNPLAMRRNTMVQVDSLALDAHCQMLNNLDWVRNSGKPYRVVMGANGKRTLARG